MNELKKTIGFMPAFMTVIGSVIGAVAARVLPLFVSENVPL